MLHVMPRDTVIRRASVITLSLGTSFQRRRYHVIPRSPAIAKLIDDPGFFHHWVSASDEAYLCMVMLMNPALATEPKDLNDLDKAYTVGRRE